MDAAELADDRNVFQSTLSVRRATGNVKFDGSGQQFQSTLSVRRATRCDRWDSGGFGISIHALRKESDHRPCRFLIPLGYFNPRSP